MTTKIQIFCADQMTISSLDDYLNKGTGVKAGGAHFSTFSEWLRCPGYSSEMSINEQTANHIFYGVFALP